LSVLEVTHAEKARNQVIEFCGLLIDGSNKFGLRLGKFTQGRQTRTRRLDLTEYTVIPAGAAS
jgi:hypothetical protein